MKKLWVVVLSGVIFLGAISILGCGSSRTQPAGGNTGTTQPDTNQPNQTQPNQAQPSPTQPSANAVVLKNFSFQPSQITIAIGDTVTWTNEDSTTHTVTGDKTDRGDDFDSGSLEPGEQFSHTFTESGTYAYHCMIHPNMKATVIVND